MNFFSKTPLTRAEASAAMNEILDGADPHQVAAFLAILKYRGETAEEIAGMVDVLQKRALPVSLPSPLIDIVGTGGDGAHTVNISTGAAILAAACGLPVAKHGNRSVSSRSGSADLLEAFGVDIEAPPEKYFEAANFAFLYAPYYHPSFKALAPIRKGLKVPTIFNLLGPLLNPAKAEYLLIGTASEAALELLSDAAMHLQVNRALIFHGCGLDELTPLGKVIAYEIRSGEKRRLEIDPAELGFLPCTLDELRGGEAAMNASILKEVFAGGGRRAIADALVFTAGAALSLFGCSLPEGIEEARKVLNEGRALKTLTKLLELSCI